MGVFGGMDCHHGQLILSICCPVTGAMCCETAARRSTLQELRRPHRAAQRLQIVSRAGESISSAERLLVTPHVADHHENAALAVSVPTSRLPALPGLRMSQKPHAGDARNGFSAPTRWDGPVPGRIPVVANLRPTPRAEGMLCNMATPTPYLADRVVINRCRQSRQCAFSYEPFSWHEQSAWDSSLFSRLLINGLSSQLKHDSLHGLTREVSGRPSVVPRAVRFRWTGGYRRFENVFMLMRFATDTIRKDAAVSIALPG